MKLFAKAIALTLIMAGALGAQAQEKLYAVVEYMHIPEGRNQQDYLALEKLWQRLHQKAVDSGICRAWYLNRVENGGKNQFVTVRVYESLDKMANPWPGSLSAGLYNSEESAKMRQTGQLRDLTHQELWRLESSASKSIQDRAPSVVAIHFMKVKPGKYREYYEMEGNQYQKIHNARIEAGQLHSWFFMSRMFPGGTDAKYDFITINGYPQKGVTWDDKIAQSALSREEWEQLPNPDDLRAIVRQEIWHPVLRTTPAKK